MDISHALNVAGSVGLMGIAGYVTLRMELTSLARQEKYFTFPEEARFKYIMRGGKPVEIVFSSRTHTVDQETGNVRKLLPGEKAPDGPTLIEKHFGVRPVGYAEFKIYEYDFIYDRFRRPDDDPEELKKNGGYEPVEGSDIVTRRSKTKYLAFRYVYPILVRKAETCDGAEIDLEGTITVEVCNALTPVFNLNGEWFLQIRDEAHGAVTEFVRQFDIVQFPKVSKTDETLPPFAYKKPEREFGPQTKEIAEQDEQLKKEATPLSLHQLMMKTKESTAKSTGMIIVSFNFKRWDYSDKTLKEAARQKEVKTLLAAGVRAETDGDVYKIRHLGMANADAARRFVRATGLSPDGAKVLIAREYSGAIAAHRGTLVLGSNPGGTFLGIDSETPARPLVSAPEESADLKTSSTTTTKKGVDRQSKTKRAKVKTGGNTPPPATPPT